MLVDRHRSDASLVARAHRARSELADAAPAGLMALTQKSSRFYVQEVLQRSGVLQRILQLQRCCETDSEAIGPLLEHAWARAAEHTGALQSSPQQPVIHNASHCVLPLRIRGASEVACVQGA